MQFVESAIKKVSLVKHFRDRLMSQESQQKYSYCHLAFGSANVIYIVIH